MSLRASANLTLRYHASESRTPGSDLLIITTWFIRKFDPQEGEVSKHASVDYGRGWIESLQRLQLNGLILHDGLPHELMAAYPYHKLRFAEVSLGRYSTNDERFFMYYILLSGKEFNDSTSHSRSFLHGTGLRYLTETIVFFTDLRDVIIKRSPLILFNQHHSKIFVGSSGKRASLAWNRRKARKCRVDITFGKQEIYNAGILGGEGHVVLRFLDCFLRLYNQVIPSRRRFNCNMPVFNAALRTCFNDSDIVTGEPLHSQFWMMEFNREDVCFIHKR